MKTRTKRKMLIQYKDIPYTLIGNTRLTPQFTITLKGKGIKTIAEKMKDDDILNITVYNGDRATDFELITEEEYE